MRGGGGTPLATFDNCVYMCEKGGKSTEDCKKECAKFKGGRKTRRYKKKSRKTRRRRHH